MSYKIGDCLKNRELGHIVKITQKVKLLGVGYVYDLYNISTSRAYGVCNESILTEIFELCPAAQLLYGDKVTKEEYK